MDILELLNEELKNNNWTIEEKVRYLYLRSCEIFSYDPRYDFLDSKEQETIRNRTFDLRNIEDRRVVCTTHAREIYSEIIRELLGLNISLMGKAHIWTKVETQSSIIKADATIQSDLERVKMNLSTKGYLSITKDYTFLDKLKIIDKKIGYIKKEYQDTVIQRKKENLQEEFEHQKNSEEIENDDFIIYQWYTIKKLFEEYKNFLIFTDAEYCISYLESKFIGQAGHWKSNTVSLYQIEENDCWYFFNIYPVKLQNDRLYFLLEQKKEEFCFYEISESEALHYVKSINGSNKYLIKQ